MSPLAVTAAVAAAAAGQLSGLTSDAERASSIIKLKKRLLSSE